MKKFSERYEYSQSNDQFQIDTMSQELRTGLWNIIYRTLVRTIHTSDLGQLLGKKETKLISGEIIAFNDEIVQYFQKPIDDFSSSKDVIKCLKYFFIDPTHQVKWFQIYDFVEFIARHIKCSKKYSLSKFIKDCNIVLEKEKSGWRINKNGLIIPLMDKHEVTSINESTKNKIYGGHIKKALEYVSKKENPDYENSIKESISAVESLVKTICQQKSGTLGKLINDLIKTDSVIHPSLLKGFGFLYGFTSDADGVRHGSMDGQFKSDLDTAIYMLIACSAFCNFLSSKYKQKLSNIKS